MLTEKGSDDVAETKHGDKNPLFNTSCSPIAESQAEGKKCDSRNGETPAIYGVPPTILDIRPLLLLFLPSPPIVTQTMNWMGGKRYAIRIYFSYCLLLPESHT